jgi:uncharacterized protein with HEPN domain
MKENEKIILKKIKIYAEQIIQFRDGMDFVEFSRDAKTIAACVLNLSQIGELVRHLDNEFMNANAHIPWRKIRGMGNRIAHDYEGIQLNQVWDVIVDFLPELIENIDKLI